MIFKDSDTKKQLLDCTRSFAFSNEYAVDTNAPKNNLDVLYFLVISFYF